jgi:hypothetical protein
MSLGDSDLFNRIEFEKNTRAQGVVAGLALALVLVLGVAVVTLAAPSMAGDSGTDSVKSEAEATAEGVPYVFESANQYLMSESWVRDTAPGTPAFNDKVDAVFQSGGLSSIDGLTQYAVKSYLGEYLSTTQTTQTQRGDIADIEPVTFETATQVDYIGPFAERGSTLTLADDVTSFYEGTLKLMRGQLASSQSNGVTMVVDDGANQWQATFWKHNNEIRMVIDGDTHSVTANEVKLDLVNGKINGNDVSFTIGDGVSNPAEVRLESIGNDWGGVSLLVDGDSSLAAANNDPATGTGEKARSVEVITRAVFDVNYQSDSASSTERVEYTFDPSSAYSMGSIASPPDPANFEVQVVSLDYDVTPFNVVNKGPRPYNYATATVEITNTGGLGDSQTITLNGEAGGSTEDDEDSETVTLDGGDSTTVTLKWDFGYGYDDKVLAVIAESEDRSDRVQFHDGGRNGNNGNRNGINYNVDGVVIDSIGGNDYARGNGPNAVVDGSEDTIVVETDRGQDCRDLSVSGPAQVQDRDGVGCELQLGEGADNGDEITITDGSGESGSVQVGGGGDNDRHDVPSS